MMQLEMSLTTLSQGADAKMSSLDALRQSVRQSRHVTDPVPAAPTSLNSLVINDSFKRTAFSW